MTPADTEAHFLDHDANYFFARWHRAIVPVIIGVDDKTLSVVKGAIEHVVMAAGHQISETDPDMGANLMVFFVADWDELTAVPDLAGLVPEIGELVPKLKARAANQYRLFRFERNGAIRAAFVFLCMDQALSEMAAEDLALAQAAQVILVWGSQAFAERSPLARASGVTVLRPEIAALIRAGYDPVLPDMANDRAHGLRLFARIGTNL